MAPLPAEVFAGAAAVPETALSYWVAPASSPPWCAGREEDAAEPPLAAPARGWAAREEATPPLRALSCAGEEELDPGSLTDTTAVAATTAARAVVPAESTRRRGGSARSEATRRPSGGSPSDGCLPKPAAARSSSSAAN